MSRRRAKARGLPPTTVALLLRLAQRDRGIAPLGAQSCRKSSAADVTRLLSEDLAQRNAAGLEITAAGRAFLRRRGALMGVDAFRAQHLGLARQVAITADGPAMTTVDELESPLAWLARRKSRAGASLIAPVQLLAGERLRADFTFAQLTPRTTMNWDAAATPERGAQGGDANPSDTVIAARRQVRGALDAAGPEFAGLLLDVCCFLKRLDDVERERRWPPRTAKIVLQLGLDRLARHYGLENEARGRARGPMRAWRGAAICVADAG